MVYQYACRMIDRDFLKSARNASGLSQAELARRSGVAQQLIGQLERGEVRSTKAIFRIADALGVAAGSRKPVLVFLLTPH